MVRATQTDIIISDIDRSIKTLQDHQITTDATSAVVTVEKDGSVKRVFFTNGTFLRYKNQKWEKKPTLGVVEQVDYQKGEVKIAVREKERVTSDHSKVQVAHFSNELRSTVHPVKSMEKAGNSLLITVGDDLIVGKIQVKSQDGTLIATENSMPLYAHYRGTALLDVTFKRSGLVKEARTREIRLTSPLSSDFSPGSEVWLGNIGVGDQVEIKPVFSKTF